MTSLAAAGSILRDLVMLKSTAEDDVQPLVQYVTTRLERLHLKVRMYNQDGRPAIIAQSGEAGVLLSGHLDTVPHGADWEYDEGEVLKGCMYGRGTCDMKGGCAAVLLAAERLAGEDVPFSLCFTTDEETGMKGAGAAAEDEAMKTASAILVAEPTDFDIVVKEKGLLQLLIRTSGVSAHASMPNLGENAIDKMTSLLCKLGPLAKVSRNPLDSMTLCIDVIRGGTQINVIPSFCEAEIDIRYPSDMTSESVLGLIKSKIGGKGYELRTLHQLDPVETDPKLPAVRVLKEILGKDARTVTVPYATEMVMFRGSGRPMMVCGPGDTKLCHANDEHIIVADVERAAKAYFEFCKRMASLKP